MQGEKKSEIDTKEALHDAASLLEVRSSLQSISAILSVVVGLLR
jgi:hypothetical protein